jgi:hypothetical protein
MPKTSKNRTYPMTMDAEIYKLARTIAEAQCLTMKEVLRVSIGLYIAHNAHSLSIIKKRRPPQPPLNPYNRSHRIKNDQSQ